MIFLSGSKILYHQMVQGKAIILKASVREHVQQVVHVGHMTGIGCMENVSSMMRITLKL